MSAPQTNLEKQKRRHRGPLIGISLGLLVGAGLAVFWAGSDADTSNPPTDAAPATVQPDAPGAAAPPNP